MSLPPGHRLGAYEIVGKIGSGGMGDVYRARDTRLDRIVAVKVLGDEVSGDQVLRQRFEREARAVAALNHPHICVLHDVGDQDGTGYLVMEYLDGSPLSDRLREGPLPLDQVFRYAIQVAGALAKAHSQGITHRDLKPANVMLASSGAKLLDFGLAKLQEGPAMSEKTMTLSPSANTAHGVILGTFHYMAPEQMRGEPTDTRTDIFSYGALLYEMVTGIRAFAGNDPATVAAATLTADPQPMKALQPAVPAALERLVRQCLAKIPDERWQSMRDVELELEWIQHASPETMTAVTARKPSVLPWSLAAFAAVVAVALAVARNPFTEDPASNTEAFSARFEVPTPLTRDPASFALSADGKQLVFAAFNEGVSRLWLRRLDQFAAQPLAGTDNGVDPFWAPDGQSIAFFADGKLKRLDLRGGQPQVIADALTSRGGAWGPDGTIVFAPTTAGPLMSVAVTGGTPRAITTVQQGPQNQSRSHRWPQFLPDGRHFLFLSTFGELVTQGVYVGSLDGGEPTFVLPGSSAPATYAAGSLISVRQSKLVAFAYDLATGTVGPEPVEISQTIAFEQNLLRPAFAASPSGVLAFRTSLAEPRQLRWVARNGAVEGTLGTPDPDALAAPNLSPDGRRVVVFRTQTGNTDIWMIPTGAGVPSRFTFDLRADVAPTWSADGQRVFFGSARQGPVVLYERSVGGAGDDRPLHEIAETRVTGDASPDGKYLLYAAVNQKTGVDLWVLPLTGGGSPSPVLQTPFDEMAGQISPNGRWVAYQSTGSGRMDVYVCAFPTGCGPQQVSSAGGSQPRWSADGRELFYVAPDGLMMAVPIRHRTGAEIEAGPAVPLFAARLATGANIPGSVGSRPQYDVAPDGRFLINSSVEGAMMPPINIVLDVRSVLKQ
jgi:serine/threonine protein kinase/dipeptidyl aminopeptidase/acylaminoacyl peptidase